MRKYAKNKKSREYRLLKHRYKILLKSKSNVDAETFRYDKIMECHVTENMILETLLSFDDELRQAYNAKEEYLIFDQVSKEEVNNSDKRKELNAVIKKFRHTHVEESVSVAETLEHWKEEILNSFTWIVKPQIQHTSQPQIILTINLIFFITDRTLFNLFNYECYKKMHLLQYISTIIFF